jgi:dihydropteroate synthase
MPDKVTFFHNKSSIRCNEKLFELHYPLVMGVINLTPDSFYKYSRYQTEAEIISRIETMISEGADIIDIGAISTRPGADILSEEIEKQRLFPVLKIINSHFKNLVISIDTFRSDVAKIAVNEYNAGIINDISGGTLDCTMFKVVQELKVPYVIMHLKGTPRDMQSNIRYNNFLEEIFDYFLYKINLLKESGLTDIIIDPGFGFSKTIEQNYELLNKLDLFKIFELPVLVGLSRKSMINKVLVVSPEDALNGTTVLNTIALSKGANILRVHDVKEAKQTISIFQKYLNSGFTE